MSPSFQFSHIHNALHSFCCFLLSTMLWFFALAECSPVGNE